MKGRLRDLLVGLRRRHFTPVLARFDFLDGRVDSLENRLEKISRRLDDIEALIQAIGTRASTLSEQSVGIVESEARIAKRVEEIERLLGAPAPDA